MTDRYQVTARFGNVYRIVGADTVDREEATRLTNVLHFANRDVRVHKLVGDGSVVVQLTR